jgi:uridine kinase
MRTDQSQPLLIGIAGGSGSGKTYFTRQVQEAIGREVVSILSMDQYFITEPETRSSDINFDHPAHLDIALMLEHIADLRRGKSVAAPGYDFRERRRTSNHVYVEAKPVILVEGLFVLAHPIVDLLDLSCFLDVEVDQRLLGRILRDMQERDSSIGGIIDRYQRYVRPSYHVFVAPSKQNADVVVDFTYRRHFFLDILVSWISTVLSGSHTVDDVVRHLRGESYRPGYDVNDPLMLTSVDIRELAKAYPENSYLVPESGPTARPHLLLNTEPPN